MELRDVRYKNIPKVGDVGGGAVLEKPKM